MGRGARRQSVAFGNVILEMLKQVCFAAFRDGPRDFRSEPPVIAEQSVPSI
jgi:hypothetical protein